MSDESLGKMLKQSFEKHGSSDKEGNLYLTGADQTPTKIGKIKDENPLLDLSKLSDRIRQIEEFWKEQPFFYDKHKLWFFWNDKTKQYIQTDEVDILNSLNLYGLDIVRTKNRSEILNALKQVGRKKIPSELKNPCIQFQENVYDLKTNEMFSASPDYFVTNPIPWKLGDSEKTPEIDGLFSSWVDNPEELYEIISFCMVNNYFIHRMFCLIGSGSNGKSTFLRILEKCLGILNITSSSLNLLMKERFEGSKLYNKLLCLMGETNFNLISNTDYLKKLTGEDLVRAEFKGKDCFDFRNYSKLIMATNSFPPTADKTEGFYRRWKIIKFEQKFTKEEDVLSKIPDKEYENLCLKCLNIAKKLWKKRTFTNDGSFEERKKRYEDESNPLSKFLKDNCEKNPNGEILFSEFFEDFKIYLEENGMRSITAPTLSKQLRIDGFEIKTLTRNKINGKYILGVKLLKLSKLPNSILNPYIGSNIKQSNSSNMGNSEEEKLLKEHLKEGNISPKEFKIQLKRLEGGQNV